MAFTLRPLRKGPRGPWGSELTWGPAISCSRLRFPVLQASWISRPCGWTRWITMTCAPTGIKACPPYPCALPILSALRSKSEYPWALHLSPCSAAAGSLLDFRHGWGGSFGDSWGPWGQMSVMSARCWVCPQVAGYPSLVKTVGRSFLWL